MQSIDDLTVRSEAINRILLERLRQCELWGRQEHSLSEWVVILGEEYGEVCEAVSETIFDNATKRASKGGIDNIIKEATHVAAVALQILEACLVEKGQYEDK